MMMTETERREWNRVVEVQVERDHEAAIHEDRVRTAEANYPNFGWAAGLTRYERDAIESRAR